MVPSNQPTEKNQMDYQTSAKKIIASGDRGFCVPFALSVLTDLPFDTVNQIMFDRNLRKKGRGSYQRNWEPLLHELLDVEDVTEQVRNLGVRTVKSAARILTKGKYFVKVRRHALALVNGKVQDWTEGRQHRIIQVWKVKGSAIIDLPRTPRSTPKQSSASPLMDKLVLNGLPEAQLTISGKWVKFVKRGHTIYFSPSRKGVQVFIKYSKEWTEISSEISHILGMKPELKKAYATWFIQESDIKSLIL